MKSNFWERVFSEQYQVEIFSTCSFALKCICDDICLKFDPTFPPKLSLPLGAKSRGYWGPNPQPDDVLPPAPPTPPHPAHPYVQCTSHPSLKSIVKSNKQKKRQTKKKKKKVYVQPFSHCLRLLRGTSRHCGLVLVPLGQRSKFELIKEKNKEKLKKKKKSS